MKITIFVEDRDYNNNLAIIEVVHSLHPTALIDTINEIKLQIMKEGVSDRKIHGREVWYPPQAVKKIIIDELYAAAH